MKFYEKLFGRTMVVVGVIVLSLLVFVPLQDNKIKIQEVRELKVFVLATSSKIPEDKVKKSMYIEDIKCKDTAWTNDIYVDNNYNVWLNPNSHIRLTYIEHEPIKIIKQEDSTFIVDLQRCQEDYRWLMFEVDFKLQGYYEAKKIIYKERIKNDTKKK